jgi:hypothetical protein
MAIGSQETAVTGIPAARRLTYPRGTLRSFSLAAIANFIATVALTATTAAVAIAYAHRITVIHHVIAHRATLAEARSADSWVRGALDATVAVSLAWVVSTFAMIARIKPMLGVSDDRLEQRRRFKTQLRPHPDWAMFRRWEKIIQVNLVVWVALRFAIPTSNAGTLAHLESLNRRGMVLNLVDAALLVVTCILAWRARTSIERGAAQP